MSTHVARCRFVSLCLAVLLRGVTPEPDEIARRLRAARELRGVGQKELNDNETLKTNGLGWTTIGRIERGERAARPMELRVIAEALDVPYEFLAADDPFSGGEQLNMLQAELAAATHRLALLLERLDDATPAEQNGASDQPDGEVTLRLVTMGAPDPPPAGAPDAEIAAWIREAARSLEAPAEREPRPTRAARGSSQRRTS